MGCGADRRWPRLHRVLGGERGFAVERRPAQPAEQHVAVGDHEREAVQRSLDAPADLADAVVEPAGDDVVSGEVNRARFGRLLALAR